MFQAYSDGVVGVNIRLRQRTTHGGRIMATNRLLLGLLVGNLVVTALLIVWVVSVATGNSSWLPNGLNPTAAVSEDLDDALAAADSVEYEVSEAQSTADDALALADDAQVTAFDAQGMADDAQLTAETAIGDVDGLCQFIEETFYYELDVRVSGC